MTVRWSSHPELREPALVAAFEGWNDAGDGASDALSWLTRALDADEFATIDPDEYFDFQATRPRVELVGGVIRRITWPATRFLAARTRDGSRDLVLVAGVEPNLHWPAFCREILDVAEASGCRTAITLGALLADVPHSRPVALTGTADDPRAAARLGLQRSRYEGPTGIVGVLHGAFREAGLPSASLWAPVPHYAATPPNPKATHALLDRLGKLLGLSFGLDPLERAAEEWEKQVGEAVRGDSEVTDYVSRLEERYDSAAGEEELPTEEEPLMEEELPSGDALAADIEKYLREQDET